MWLAVTPSEVSFEWVYAPPFLFTVVFGFVGTYGVTRFLNRTGWSRFFWYPELAFLALWVLLTSLLGLFVLPP